MEDDVRKELEMLSARCTYLGIVFSALLQALPDKGAFLASLQAEVQINDANSLYATSLSDRQQQTIHVALDELVKALTPKPNSQA
ncbi:MAG: hypothetical protein J5W83_09910 [Candidatus Accumulibacter sp.]|uniref:hypothetical protein n=1 Tax=Accumulibacter sp. TaxID=2053492 RepID=UPI001B0D8836|nr:hypothetical protein [Accumulibacter sp.]MBO3702842.1 hypothetical protein [Accumulibacter sp.]